MVDNIDSTLKRTECYGLCGHSILFEQNTLTKEWVQTDKLTPINGSSNDHFGGSVAISNNIIVIGSYGDADNGVYAGSVYIFERNDSSSSSSSSAWIQTAKLTAHDGSLYDYFGISVAISDDNIIVVGAHKDDDRKSFLTAR